MNGLPIAMVQAIKGTFQSDYFFCKTEVSQDVNFGWTANVLQKSVVQIPPWLLFPNHFRNTNSIY